MLLCRLKPLLNTLFYNTVSSNSQTKLAPISENQEQQNQSTSYSRANSITGTEPVYAPDSGADSRQHSNTTNGEDVPLSSSLNRILEGAQDDVFGESDNTEQDIER